MQSNDQSQEKKETKKSTKQVPEDPRTVRIKAHGVINTYVKYAQLQLQTHPHSVELIATGNAISKAITVTEILKRLDQTIQQQNTLTAVKPPNTCNQQSSDKVLSQLTLKLQSTKSQSQ